MTAGQGFLDWAKNASVAGGLIRGSRRAGSRAFAMGMGMMSGDKVIRSAAMGGMRRGLGAMGMPALMGMGIGAGANFALNSLGNIRRGDPVFSGGFGAAVRGGMGGAMAGGIGQGLNRLGRTNSSFWSGMRSAEGFGGHLGTVSPMLGKFGMGL